jgi:hypothetical protein
MSAIPQIGFIGGIMEESIKNKVSHLITEQNRRNSTTGQSVNQTITGSNNTQTNKSGQNQAVNQSIKGNNNKQTNNSV